jgi:uncharacterized BrkB/YihY/UPF0761 family membrane protein
VLRYLRTPERLRRWLPSHPGFGATAILFLVFLVCLGAGLAHDQPTQIVIGATGMLACLILFMIGFVVTRLK